MTAKPMINVDRETYEAHLAHYPRAETETRLEARMIETADIASRSDDWRFFRFYEGSVTSGQVEMKYALSPSLGISRRITMPESYSLRLYPTKASAERACGPLGDPLANELVGDLEPQPAFDSI